MLRIAIILLILIVLFRWAFGQWPWQSMQGTPSRSQRISRARQLLRVEKGASREDVLAAHKKLLAKVHPDKGGTNADVHEANDARDLLLEDLPPPTADIERDDPS
ncbi:molecular chaperone DnaJ [Erythrobacter sp. MTPC3]|uniref:molecular chaperone DnaJ n=1 Tax=Erythrobacter sp. MTPC3 TaxID=3056564 RepID=UPI0036F20165